MRILGLTGSIAMGKSTAASMLAAMHCPVHDADAVVHDLFAPGGAAVAPVAQRFPAALSGQAIDRQRLSSEVFGNAEALAALEAIVHPLVGAALKRFLRYHQRCGTDLVVLDVPLLFEVGADKRCDMVVVVDCAPSIQQQRYLRRKHASLEKLAHIRARQMPQAEKRRRADIIIPTGGGRALAWQALAQAKAAALDLRTPPVWPIHAYRKGAFRGPIHSFET